MSNTFFVLAVCGGKIISYFLKFSRTGGGGARSGGGGGLSDTFLVLEFFGEKKLSQIFSKFLGIHFYVLAFWENYLKFSQKFSNVSVDFEQNICPK